MSDAQAENSGDDDLFKGGAQINTQIYSYNKKEDLFFGGVNYKELKKYDISEFDIDPYMPIKDDIIQKSKVEILVLPYYLNYNPQDSYYFASENSNFQPNPKRTDGTYSKYNSIDDKIDDIHFYTWFIKTGRGRATYDAALEVRNKIIDRDEAVALVKKYDGEFPKTYIKDNLDYLGITLEKFNETIDKFRPQHLWEKKNGKWVLKQAVWK